MLTDAQVDLLQRLIRADRWWRSKKERGEYESLDYRGIEVSPLITGVYRRTAEALCNAGLAEMLDMGNGITYVFLGKYLPYDYEPKEDEAEKEETKDAGGTSGNTPE